MASSETDATSGIDRMPTAMLAARMLNPDACGLIRWTTSGLMTAIAKKPRTMLGMPARISRIGLTKLRVRGEAYSARKIALKSPIGAASFVGVDPLLPGPRVG